MKSSTILTIFSGVLHIVLVILSHIHFSDYGSGRIKPSRSALSRTRDGGVLPIPCHSHNDYWRDVPLFDALDAGCISVEVDLWLTSGSDELRVGHRKGSLTSTRTLESLYLDPVVRLLDRINKNVSPGSTTIGAFEKEPNQTMILLLDFKTDPNDLLPFVEQAIEPLRRKDYLSFWDGKAFISRPITIILSGNAIDLSSTMINATTHRDLFFDAPLDKLPGKTPQWNASNAYYASTSFKSSIGFPRNGRLSKSQLNKLRSQIEAAQSLGLKVRYWDTPTWPTSLRNYVWQLLIDEGVDVLNVDDLYAAAYLDWKEVGHDWFDS
ncbi:uncharacterized protein RCC_06155 [Ramularia collo-cygni]|uniref:Altered inheritance of mitochondria protein 6 n=1 Tax=Ramularia collo-cygni TaxID=112498 RepID=A0A2D3V6G4_9PEZI|nr:uncharacterized protein RCC_06155 [Ramularia collo-cygni]CZT20297.1 uncharacterized protein RCC_06155 [Ramularia collo-cygni]